MRRLKRKQLKEDELISTFSKISRFAKKHIREIYFLLIFAVVILLVFSGHAIYKNYRAKKNSEIVREILSLSSQLEQSPEKIKKLEELALQKGIARSAGIFLASYYIENGELDRAEKQLESFPERPKDFFYYQALSLKSNVYFNKGEYEKALSILLGIEQEKPKDFVLDFVFYKIAQCYEKLGKKNEALVYYQKIQQEYPQSFYAFDASQKIRFLE